MNMTTRDKRALTLGVALLVVLVGYRYALAPWWASWQTADDRIAAADEQRSTLRYQLTHLTNQRRDLADVYGPSIGRPLPTIDQARVHFVDVIEQVLKRAGVKSKSVRSQPTQRIGDVPGVSIVALQVSASAKPQQLAKCMAEMAKARQLLVVQRMSVGPSPGHHGGNALDVSMVIGTFATGTPGATTTAGGMP